MRETDLKYLACPRCVGDLIISSVDRRDGAILMSARLQCAACQTWPLSMSTRKIRGIGPSINWPLRVAGRNGIEDRGRGPLCAA